MALIYRGVAYNRAFKMIDGANHVAPKTGLSLVVKLSKDGNAFGALNGTTSEIGNGWYKLALNTTDTNTIGDLAYFIVATGTTTSNFADDTDFVDQVVNFNPVDGTRMGLLALPNSAATTAGGLPTVGTSASQIDVDSSGRVNVGKWLGGVIPSQNIAGIPNVNVSYFAAGTAPLPSTSGVPKVDVQNWTGTAVATPNVAGIPVIDMIRANGTTLLTPSSGKIFALASLAGTSDANIVQIGGVNIPTPSIGGVPIVDVRYFLGGTAPNTATTGVPKVDVANWTGTAVTTPDTAGSPKVTITAGTGAGQLDFTSGVVKGDLRQVLGGAVPAVNTTGVPKVDVVNWTGGVVPAQNIAGIPNVNVTYFAAGTAPLPTITGVPKVDLQDILGTIVSTPATAGVLDVNIKNISNSTVSATTAQLGVNVVNYNNQAVSTTVSGIPKVDMVDILGTAVSAPATAGILDVNLKNISNSTVSTSSAQIGTNVVNYAGSVVPAQNIPGIPNVNVTYWAAGTAPIPTTVGVPTVNLAASQLFIKKNVAYPGFTFPMIDSSDHVTLKSGLTLAANVSLDGGSFSLASGTTTEIGSSGVYKINLASGDTNGTEVMLRFTSAGADTQLVKFTTQP